MNYYFLTIITLYTGATALSYSYFGNGPDPHIISNLYCSGSESSLLSCSHNFINAALYCGDSAVAGAICLGTIIRINELSLYIIV